ncbi:DNA-binding CsgD family transcriptional regulator/GAF domain-containing protein [Bradyrhizobium sp. AZCC 1678]|uniref:helix-turn-helix transcriptional regulator n=1 Tax=Bradyrhizobium sp. AZCC 1678 TaxID=3117030 RepID=UPI002FF27EFC
MSGDGLSGEDRVLDLVGSIYDAALDAQLWPGVLNRIGDAVGGPQVVFGFYDPANGIVSMHAPRTDPDILRSFDEWTPDIPALPCTGNYRPGEVFTGADVISRDEFTSTAFYNELWRPGGFSADPLVTNLFADSAASGHIASHGLLNRSPFDGSQKRLFAALAQHLVRAVALQRRVYHLTIANERALTGLDGLQQGFLLVDAEARPLFVNRAARALLDSRDGLRLEADALSASDADGGRTLRRLIKSCAGDASAVTGSGGDVALPRGAERSPLDVVVTPVKQEAAKAIIPWTFSQRAVAIVLVSDPEREIQARVEGLRQRFGFTPAEAAFALEIVKGDGRQAAADRLGITVGTARSHLSSIFDKTGSRRQAELVRLLLQK